MQVGICLRSAQFRFPKILRRRTENFQRCSASERAYILCDLPTIIPGYYGSIVDAARVVIAEPISIQITLLHGLNIVKSWGTQRLIPTTVCGLVTLVSFEFTAFVSLFAKELSITGSFLVLLNH